MENIVALFFSTFTTLIAVINPFETLPVFLTLVDGKSKQEQNNVAFKSCLYATILTVFFFIFGALVLKIFGVNLSMVRIVGGIILMKIGFSLFMPNPNNQIIGNNSSSNSNTNIAFVPLAIPIMFGPGALATVLGMTSLIKNPFTDFVSIIAIITASILSMSVIYVILRYANPIVSKIGANGIDAATRIVGFFVAAMGMGLIFHGLVDFLHTNNVIK